MTMPSPFFPPVLPPKKIKNKRSACTIISWVIIPSLSLPPLLIPSFFYPQSNTIGHKQSVRSLCIEQWSRCIVQTGNSDYASCSPHHSCLPYHETNDIFLSFIRPCLGATYSFLPLSPLPASLSLFFPHPHFPPYYPLDIQYCAINLSILDEPWGQSHLSQIAAVKRSIDWIGRMHIKPICWP